MYYVHADRPTVSMPHLVPSVPNSASPMSPGDSLIIDDGTIQSKPLPPMQNPPLLREEPSVVASMQPAS